MSIIIEIQSTELRELSGNKNGKPWTIREQTGWAFTYGRDGKPNPHPERVAIALPRDQAAAYSPGRYTLHPSSFYVGAFNALALSVRLTPAK